jgi:hypothetical protein
MYYKNAKNAELQGLRFSISLSQMRNELGSKGTNYFLNSKQKAENIFCRIFILLSFNNLLLYVFPKILNVFAVENQIPCSEKGRISKYDFTFSDLMYNRKNWRNLNKDKTITRQEAEIEVDTIQQEAYLTTDNKHKSLARGFF